MTHRLDVARGRDIVARWCVLAEQRLEYLTELFQTGRWRRYHSEHAFLENIQEAKAAVETWRDLSVREASPDNSAVDVSWLGQSSAPLPRGRTLHAPAFQLAPLQTQIQAEPSRSRVLAKEVLAKEVLAKEVLAEEILAAAEMEQVSSEEAPSVPDLEMAALEEALPPTLDAIEQRYPLLRNAL